MREHGKILKLIWSILRFIDKNKTKIKSITRRHNIIMLMLKKHPLKTDSSGGQEVPKLVRAGGREREREVERDRKRERERIES